ncbi:MAG TPA: BadF/BadG/BcrA/BcrD ATPase family protein [Pyrinomonadaceae bacterium]|nr:BadF/BadG/BcrA/BcrD ATPase family protein [Pyrinomonadaceae bacterium]
MTAQISKRHPSKRFPGFHNLFLGVDGGGTKTHIVLLDAEKAIVGEAFSGASNPLRVGIEKAAANIFAAVDQACDNAGLNQGDIVAIECGLAGVRRADLRQILRRLVVQRFSIKTVEINTDAEIALFAATQGKEGLCVIAGTGSVCIGQNSEGKKAIAGGWGPLAGDEGGGAGIARRALQAVAKASDGRGQSTNLSDLAVDYFRAGRLEDLSVAIYAPQIDNARIAGFARHVIETARAGDRVAISVLEEAGRELGLAAKAVIKELKMARRKFPIGYVGGIFHAGDLIFQPLLESVREIAPKAFIAAPKFPPAVAAAQMALQMSRSNGRNGKNGVKR